MIKFAIIGLLLIATLALCGCGATGSSPTLLSISVTTSAPSIAVGSTTRFTATGIYSDSSTRDLTSSAVWTSTNTAVARVATTGIATAISAGSSLISATVGSVSGSATLTIASVNASVNLVPFRTIFYGLQSGSQLNFPVLSGTDSQGNSWTGSYSLHALGTTTYDGQTVTELQKYITTQQAGTTAVSSSVSLYFLLSNGNPYRGISSTGLTTTFSSPVTLPTTATIGQFGSLWTSNQSDGTVVTTTWQVDSGSNGGSVLTISDAMSGSPAGVSNVACKYYIDMNGNPTSVSISLSTGGITLYLSGNRV